MPSRANATPLNAFGLLSMINARLSAVSSPACKIFELAGLAKFLKYSFIHHNLLVAGTPGSCKRQFHIHRSTIQSVVNSFRTLPEIALLDTLKVEAVDPESWETKIAYQIDLPNDSEDDGVSLLLQNGLAKLDRATLLMFLEAEGEDKVVLEFMLKSPNSCWLIDMATNTTRFSTGDVLYIDGEPGVTPAPLTWNRNVLDFWSKEDLADFTREIFQKGAIDSFKWRSKATRSSLDPTEEFYLQVGNVCLVRFQGREHRLVEMLDKPTPWKGQI